MRRDGKDSVCEATVKVRVDGENAPHRCRRRWACERARPALRAALGKFFPEFKKVQLTDYKVRILDSATGTAAKTRVLIESSDGKEEWGTVGVNENIIEASLQALVDSMEYALMKK